MCVVKVVVSVKTLDHWKESLPDLTQGYEPDSIFNADETGLLFYNVLPSKTFSMNGEPCRGGKEVKNISLCCFVAVSMAVKN
jgi:hypothetical protein